MICSNLLLFGGKIHLSVSQVIATIHTIRNAEAKRLRRRLTYIYTDRNLVYQKIYLPVWRMKCMRNIDDHWTWQAKNSVSINTNHTKQSLSRSKRSIKRLMVICSLVHHEPFVESPHCNICGEIETSEHFLYYCPTLIKATAKCVSAHHLHYDSLFFNIPMAICP